MSLIERAAAKLLEAQQRQQQDDAKLPTLDPVDEALQPAALNPEREPPEPERVTRLDAPRHDAPRQGAPKHEPTEDAGHSETVQIDLDLLAQRGCLARDGEPAVLAQEYRRIKRPLLTNIKNGSAGHNGVNPANLIMVTSSLPREGKSFVSVNLALSMAAEIDQTVLLVDTDAMVQGAGALLGVQGRHGIIDVLAGRATIPEVLLRTNIPNFSFIPAGQANHQVDELYASDAMRDLMNEMASRYADRVIIFDTPPVLATSVPMILSAQVGQIAFVIEADRTQQQIVVDALENFKEHPGLGLILNKTSRRSPGSSYGYAYGYTYGAG